MYIINFIFGVYMVVENCNISSAILKFQQVTTLSNEAIAFYGQQCSVSISQQSERGI